MRIKAGRDPKLVRREQFPFLGDQIDAIYKGFKAIAASGLVQLPQETLDWIAAVDRVKEENPVTPKPMVEEKV